MISYSVFDNSAEQVVCEGCGAIVLYDKWADHSNFHFALGHTLKLGKDAGG